MGHYVSIACGLALVAYGVALCGSTLPVAALLRTLP